MVEMKAVMATLLTPLELFYNKVKKDFNSLALFRNTLPGYGIALGDCDSLKALRCPARRPCELDPHG